MPTFNNREAMSSVRAKINAAIEKIDDLDTAEVVTPQVYGALGNDTGDDTAALQAAIDACKAAGTTDGSGGKRLYIPPGTYRHTGLTVDRPITIEGAGGRRTRLRKIGNSTAPSVMIAPAHDGVDYVASTSLFANIKIKGIHLIGAGKDNIGGADGWRIQNATTNPIYTEVVLEDISAWAHAGNGLKGQTFAGPVRIYDINMSNNNLCGAEINSCVDWRIFGGEMGSNTLDSLQIAGCVQMRIYGLYVYSGGRFTANLFNSQIMWHGGAIDASATHGLNYDCRREFDYCKLIDVDFRKNGFNSSPNTYADIYVSSLATSELYLQNCGFEYPNNGASLYNIQFQGSGNYVYEAGSRFEGGDVNAANVTNAPGQLRSVGRHMYSKGDRNYATLATDVVSNEQYTGLRLTNDFVPVVALYGTTGANAGGVLDIYQPDGIAVGQRIAAPGTGVPSLLNLPGPYDDDTAATAGGVTSGCAYRQTGGGVAYVGGGASGGSINANTVYASRADAIAATVAATQNSLRLYHLGVLLEYARDPSGTALTTNSGTVAWRPAGKAYAEHYGSGAAAIAAMQADKGRVGFLTGFAVASNVTIDGDGISFSDGAYLDVSAGVTVTIRCPIKSRRQWIFRGDGAISLTHSGAGGPGENARQYHVSWFGAFPSSVSPATSAEAAIQRGFDAVGNSREAVARFDMGNYWMRGGCNAPRGVRIVGQDRRRTVFLLDGDGWDAFTTLGVAVKIEKCQVEQPVGSTPRESAFFVVNHADCEVRSFRGGYADKNFVVNASGFSAIDTYFVYDSDRGAGSSCFQLTENAAHCTIDQVDLRSSAFGVEAIVRADVPSGSLSKLQVSNIKAITETVPVWLRATGGGVIQSFAVRDIIWDYSGGLGAVCPAMVKLETEDTAEIRVGNVSGLIGSNAVEYGVSIVQGAGGSVRDIVFSGLNIGGTGYVFDRQNDLGFSTRLDVSGINLNNRELVIGGVGGLMTALPAPVHMDGQVLNAVPFGSRADVIASTLSAHITRLSYISTGWHILNFVEDPAATAPALTTNGGTRKWVPAGTVHAEHYADAVGGGGDDTAAFLAALSWGTKVVGIPGKTYILGDLNVQGSRRTLDLRGCIVKRLAGASRAIDVTGTFADVVIGVLDTAELINSTTRKVNPALALATTITAITGTNTLTVSDASMAEVGMWVFFENEPRLATATVSPQPQEAANYITAISGNTLTLGHDIDGAFMAGSRIVGDHAMIRVRAFGARVQADIRNCVVGFEIGSNSGSTAGTTNAKISGLVERVVGAGVVHSLNAAAEVTDKISVIGGLNVDVTHTATAGQTTFTYDWNVSRRIHRGGSQRSLSVTVNGATRTISSIDQDAGTVTISTPASAGDTVRVRNFEYAARGLFYAGAGGSINGTGLLTNALVLAVAVGWEVRGETVVDGAEASTAGVKLGNATNCVLDTCSYIGLWVRGGTGFDFNGVKTLYSPYPVVLSDGAWNCALSNMATTIPVSGEIQGQTRYPNRMPVFVDSDCGQVYISRDTWRYPSGQTLVDSGNVVVRPFDVPYDDRAQAIAADVQSHIKTLSYISAGGRKLEFVEDASTAYPALTTNAGARKWVPSGDAFSLDAYGVVYDSPSTDNTSAVNTAWQFSAATGRKCLGRAGTIWHGGTLIARGGMDLGSTVYGKTVFKKQAGFNGRQVVSEDFDTLTGTSSPDDAPADITIRSGIIFDGNWMNGSWEDATGYNNTSGGGVFIYAKRYNLRFQFRNQAGVGFWSEFNGTPSDMDDSKLYFLNVQGHTTLEEGIIYKGPGDAVIERMWTYATGTRIPSERATATTPRVSPTYGAENGGMTDGIVIDGLGCEIDNLRSNNAHSGGPIWFKGNPRMSVKYAVLEGCAIGPRFTNGVYGHIGFLKCHNHRGGWDGLNPGLYPDCHFTATGDGLTVQNILMETGGSDRAQDRLVIAGSRNFVRSGHIDGINLAGHGLTVSGDNNEATNIRVVRCKGAPASGGTTSAGVKRIAAATDRTYKIDATVADCDVMVQSSGTPDQEVLNVLFDGLAGQVAFVGDAKLSGSGQMWRIGGKIDGTRYMSETTVSEDFDSSILTEQTLTIPHRLIHQPPLENIQISIYDTSTNSQIGGSDQLQYAYSYSADATNIAIRIKMLVAHATNTSPRVGVEVHV